jgi:hypothetical protein
MTKKLFGYWEEDMDGSTCGYFVVSAYQPEFFADCEENFNDEHELVGAWCDSHALKTRIKDLGLDLEVSED